ncbi:unnamed protein product [Ambrosiozyma monospora]|uniref:Unnamed protein product n=1 Tax=Ambrosiozyma monospora TaxID=43982 RepID=A0ACB5SU53_AMBMO|nr:unnamed protein product [Ambrosiozyma monospora]
MNQLDSPEIVSEVQLVKKIKLPVPLVYNMNPIERSRLLQLKKRMEKDRARKAKVEFLRQHTRNLIQVQSTPNLHNPKYVDTAVETIDYSPELVSLKKKPKITKKIDSIPEKKKNRDGWFTVDTLISDDEEDEEEVQVVAQPIPKKPKPAAHSSSHTASGSTPKISFKPQPQKESSELLTKKPDNDSKSKGTPPISQKSATKPFSFPSKTTEKTSINSGRKNKRGRSDSDDETEHKSKSTHHTHLETLKDDGKPSSPTFSFPIPTSSKISITSVPTSGFSVTKSDASNEKKNDFSSSFKAPFKKMEEKTQPASSSIFSNSNSSFAFGKTTEPLKSKTDSKIEATPKLTSQNSTIPKSSDKVIADFSSQKTDKPAFSFSLSSQKTDKPASLFGSSSSEKTDKPASSFAKSSSGKTDKPAFSFGASSSEKVEKTDKPAFAFGNSTTFGAKSNESKVSSSDVNTKNSVAPTFGAPAEKLKQPSSTFKFSLDKPSNDNKKFSFGGQDQSRPETAPPSSIPSFSLGSKSNSAGGSGLAGTPQPANSTTSAPTFKFNRSGFQTGAPTATSNTASSSTTGFSFGGPTNSSSTATSVNSINKPVLPSTSVAATPSPQPSFSFGANKNNSSTGFGSANNNSSSGFGTTNSKTSDGFGFGGASGLNASNKPNQGFSFGNTQSGFGNSNNSSNSQSGFGSSNNNNSQSGFGGFGTQNGNKGGQFSFTNPSTGNAFGQTQPQTQTRQGQTFSFNNNNNSSFPSPAGSGFNFNGGQQPQQQQKPQFTQPAFNPSRSTTPNFNFTGQQQTNLDPSAIFSSAPPSTATPPPGRRRIARLRGRR